MVPPLTQLLGEELVADGEGEVGVRPADDGEADHRQDEQQQEQDAEETHGEKGLLQPGRKLHFASAGERCCVDKEGWILHLF